METLDILEPALRTFRQFDSDRLIETGDVIPLGKAFTLQGVLEVSKSLPQRDGSPGESLHLRLGVGRSVHHLPVGIMNLEPGELLAQLGCPGLGEDHGRPKLRHRSDQVAERSALGCLLELVQLALPLPHHVLVARDPPVEPQPV
jgi:hypothetical protein